MLLLFLLLLMCMMMMCLFPPPPHFLLLFLLLLMCMMTMGLSPPPPLVIVIFVVVDVYDDESLRPPLPLSPPPDNTPGGTASINSVGHIFQLTANLLRRQTKQTATRELRSARERSRGRLRRAVTANRIHDCYSGVCETPLHVCVTQ